MSNSIVDLVNQQKSNATMHSQTQNPQIQQIKTMMQQLNPETILQNPAIKNILSIVRANNLTPQQFARMLAQQKGVDINSLIRELQN